MGVLRDGIGKGCYVPAKVLGVEFRALFDTGAQCSILSRDAWDSLPKRRRPKMEPPTHALRGVNLSPVNIRGVATLEMEVDGHPIGIRRLLIAEDICDDLVLGTDLWEGLMIGYTVQREGGLETNTMKWPKEDVSSNDDDSSGSGDVLQPEVSGMLEDDEQDSVDQDALDLQDMEYLPYIPRGMDDDLPKGGYRSTRWKKLAGARLGAELAGNFGRIGAIQVEEPGGADQPPGLPEHLAKLYTCSCSELSPEQQAQLARLLIDYQDSFSKSDSDIGRTAMEVHRIPTGDAKPIRLPPRRAPMHLQADIQRQIKEMKEQGTVEDCSSAWAAPLVIVKKKDGSNRICVDYRALNQATIKDGHPLPRLDDCLDALRGAKIYTTLDMTSGYHQVEVAPEDRDKTAFVDGRGHHLRYVTMPFGLCNAPATFQRLMEKVLEGMVWDTVVVYLDDVVIFSQTIEDHMTHLKQVLDRFRQHNLKLKPRKCDLCRTQIKYLGHTVSSKGIATDPSLVERVQNWPQPTTVRKVRGFIGLANYYKAYIPDYGNLQEPLVRLTDKGAKFIWTPECQQAFETIKERLTTAPIMAFPNLEDPFILDTDASDTAIGAVLSQVQEGQERVIAYGSKVLSREERNYCVTRRELLAVVHFVDKYEYYLRGREFTIRTDHSSLRWMLNQREPRDQLARWIQKLDTYRPFNIVHRAGKHHGNADAMSRLDMGKCFRGGACLCRERGECGEATEGPEANSQPTESADTLEAATIGVLQAKPAVGGGDPAKARTGLHLKHDGSDRSTPPSAATDYDNDDRVNPATEGQEEIDSTLEPEGLTIGLSPQEVQEQQEADPDLREIKAWKETRIQRPCKEECASLSNIGKYWAGRWDQLEIRGGLLQYRWEPEDPKDPVIYRTVAPRALIPTILTALHDLKAAGHMGIGRTRERAKRCPYIWNSMLREVERWVQRCRQCQRRKAPAHRKRARMVRYQVGSPWDRVAADVLGPLPTSKNGHKYILVIQDYFTKWAEFFPMADQTAETVATILVDNIISRFGCPREFHTDQGSNFKSKLMTEVYRLMGLRKTQTTPYHPRGDGMVERANRTLEDMLSLWVDERQSDWHEHLPLLAMAYRSAPHKTTAASPNLLMFGREVTLPVDLIMEPVPNEVEEPTSYPEYIDNLQSTMRTAHQVARDTMAQQMASQKRYFDQTVHLTNYEPGDIVMCYLPANKKGRTPKLMPKWRGPYLVRHRLSDVVYRIQQSPRAKPKIVHGDIIKRCYGYTAAELGFPSQRTPSQPAEVVPGPPPQEHCRAPGGPEDEPQHSASEQPLDTPSSWEDTDQSETAEFPPPPLPQQELRRKRKRVKGSRKVNTPVQPSTPEPSALPTRTRAGRPVRAPHRYGWD